MSDFVGKIDTIKWPIASKDSSKYICCIACYYPITPLLPNTIKNFYRERFGDNSKLFGYTVEVEKLFTKDFDDTFYSDTINYHKKIVRCYNCSYILSESYQKDFIEEEFLPDLQFKFQKIPLGDYVFLYKAKTKQYDGNEMKRRFLKRKKFEEKIKKDSEKRSEKKK